jgi:4-alpha-glucanotransferase
MKFHFFVRFSTRPGQFLRIVGDSAALGNQTLARSIRMRYKNDQFWEIDMDIPDAHFGIDGLIRYRYILEEEGHEWTEEWGMDRRLKLSDFPLRQADVIDTWNHAGTYGNVFYNAPFRDVLLPERPPQKIPKPAKAMTHIFRVKAPLLTTDEELCLTGNTIELGNWQKDKVISMFREDEWWTVRLNLSKAVFPLAYKYAVCKKDSGRLLRYENGNNRILYPPERTKRHILLHDGFVHLPETTWKGTGIAIPVFSLRSGQGFGVGEFPDINLLTDWAERTGIRMIQLLPVNDTTSSHTWQDSYPYSAISAFALHPLYLNIRKMAGRDLFDLDDSFMRLQHELNNLPEVDYEMVMQHKQGFINHFFTLKGDEVFSTPDFQAFFRDNEHWLLPYAAFCFLRDKYKNPDPSQWKKHSRYDNAAILKLCDPKQSHYRKISIHFFTQYHLHLQLKEAHDYANGKGIILKGDIPIGVNRYGVEAWMEPELFDLDMQSGAPPDDFAVKGQNWGFPTYQWSRMQQDGFAWWKKRFAQMSRYFDAFRIDHILGFFRIWSIPIDAVEGIMGRFVPAIPVLAAELRDKGISLDTERYTRPFITDRVLWEMFGADEKLFKPYLRPLKEGRYALSTAFDTQQKVEVHFSQLEPTTELDRIKSGLFELISNVILFCEKDDPGERFHFRFNMEKTTSFRHLDDHTAVRLKELYIDYFFRRQDNYWEKEAMKKLPALKRSTDMLICGEDLGMVPGCVPDVMSRLGILSMEVQRMPKDPRKEFFHPGEAPYLSVVTPSSHDMSTIRGWWEEDQERTQRFFTHQLGQYSTAPKICEPWICRMIILQHIFSPAQWCVFQFQDLIAMSGELRQENPEQERINVPSNPKHYWRYRMPIPLEQLLEEDTFNAELRGYIESGGRIKSNSIADPI